MAAQLFLDTVDNSRITESGTIFELTRGFAITGMDTSVSPAALMISGRTVPGMPQNGDPHPNAPAARVVRREFVGSIQDGVVGTITYSTVNGFTPSSLIFTRDSRLVDIESDIMPDGKIIGARYDAPSGLFGGTTGESIPFDYIPQRRRVPCPSIIIEGVNFGNPNYPAQNKLGFVNGDTFQGDPPGSWMVDAFVSVYAVYQGVTTFRCVVTRAPGNSKWWLTGILISRKTGKKIWYEGIEDDIAGNVNGDYAYGEQATPGYGYSVFGGYHTVSFQSIGINPPGGSNVPSIGTIG